MSTYHKLSFGVLLCAGALFLFLGTQPTGVAISLADDNPWAGTPQEAFYNSPVRKKYMCETCHTVMDGGGTVGPSLNQVGRRRSPEWLRTWLANPPAVKPGTVMPILPFTSDEIEEVVSLLSKMVVPVDSAGILAGNGSQVDKGEALFIAYDCYACHTHDGKGGRVGPDLTDVSKRRSQKWEKKWLANPEAVKPGTFMPNFHLSEEEIAALTEFLYQK